MEEDRTLSHVQPGQHAQQHHLALLVRQRRHRLESGLGGHGLHGLLLVVPHGWSFEPLGGGPLTLSAFTAARVEKPSTGDGEHPLAEVALASLGAVEARRHRYPDLGADVLVATGVLDSQVPKDCGVELPVKRGQRPGGSGAGGLQHRLELCPEAHALLGFGGAPARLEGAAPAPGTNRARSLKSHPRPR